MNRASDPQVHQNIHNGEYQEKQRERQVQNKYSEEQRLKLPYIDEKYEFAHARSSTNIHKINSKKSVSMYIIVKILKV